MADFLNGKWSNFLVVLKTFGVTGAIALFLVYIGGTFLPKIAENQLHISNAIAAHREEARVQIDETKQVYRMLQKICVNVSKTDDERQRCFDR